MKKLLLPALAATLAMTGAALSGETIKIGFVSTFTGPSAVIGIDMRQSFELALDHLGRQWAGKAVEVIYEDDQMKPETAKQKTDKLIESDKVDFLAGYIWSNSLLSSLKSAVDSKTFLVTTNAGPSQFAGERCSPYAFSTALQNDQSAQAIGLYMNQMGVKSVFLIAPNYALGKDVLAGLKRAFTGSVVGEEYTAWPNQLDFSAELAKARNAKPDAIFAAYPGAASVQFLSQFQQMGLKGRIPLYTAYTVEETTLPMQKDSAIGVLSSQEWVNDLPNAKNRTFIEDYRKKYNGARPSIYGSRTYDAAQLIHSAVIAVNGDTSQKNAMKDEMKKANFESVRGPFKYGNNNIPIQTFYLQDVIKAQNDEYVLKTISTIVENDQDYFHTKCPLQ